MIELPRKDHFELLSKTFDTIESYEQFMKSVTESDRYPIYSFTRRASAVPHGELIGVARVYLKGKTLHISFMAVDEYCRGFSHGEMIVQDILVFAKENGIESVTANTRESNVVMTNLLTKLGFTNELNGKYSNKEIKLKFTHKL